MRLDSSRYWTILAALSLTGTIACSDVQDAVPGETAAGQGGGGAASTVVNEGGESGESSSSGDGGEESDAGASGSNECVNDLQCAPMICEDSACIAAECLEDEECTGDDVCTQGRCVAVQCTADVTFTYDPGVGTPSDVFVAGSFNGWDPTAVPLTENDDGDFTVSLDLVPGTYEYKFLIDGEWVQDASNPRSIDDTLGGVNSVLITDCDGVLLPDCVEDEECVGSDVCEDYVCMPAECMEHDDCDDAPYCTDGRCSDSACQPDSTFVYVPPGAQPLSVHLAGEFNGWSLTAEPLTEQLNGDWTVTLDDLQNGQDYEYKFVVLEADGSTTNWVTDSENPRMSGENSLALISCEGLVLPACTDDDECTDQICEAYECVAPECTIAVEDCAAEEDCIGGRCVAGCVPDVEFVYTPPGAAPTSVHLAGEFNSWSPTAEPLTGQLNGDWTVTLNDLQDGQDYEYKFVVLEADGSTTNWVTDTNNLRRAGDNSLALVSCDGLVLPECTADGQCTDQICEAYACVAPECTIAVEDCGENQECTGGRCVNLCVPQVEFVYTPPGAAPTSVHLAGEFNSWSPTAGPLTEQLNGDWTVTLDDLQDGEDYEYKFVVVEADGSTTNWVLDTNNLRQAGDNSLALVSCDGLVLPECTEDDDCTDDDICSDYACVAPECVEAGDCNDANLTCDAGHCVPATCDGTFSYSGDATNVYVAGQFNGWNPTAWALTEVSTDTWEAAFPMTVGPYEYKLVVDGNWILDPQNPNQQNTNSLLQHDCSGAGGGPG